MIKTYICTIIKDEFEYLKEWCEYHLNLGFDKIFLFEDFESKSHKELNLPSKCELISLYNYLDNKDSLYRQFNLFNQFHFYTFKQQFIQIIEGSQPFL